MSVVGIETVHQIFPCSFPPEGCGRNPLPYMTHLGQWNESRRDMHCFQGETSKGQWAIPKVQSWQSYVVNHGSAATEPPPASTGLCKDD